MRVKQLVSVGVLSQLLLAGVCAASDVDTQDAQASRRGAQHNATLDCINREILTWCFANTEQDDALSQCEDYIANTPEEDGCIGGSAVSASCGSGYWKIAAYVCP